MGRIESGILRSVITKMVILPKKGYTECKTLENNWETVSIGLPGDIIGSTPRCVSKNDIKTGSMIGDAENDPPKLVSKIVAKVFILDQVGKLKVGYEPVLHCHYAYSCCKWTKILWNVSPNEK